jgi:hypothetical protein
MKRTRIKINKLNKKLIINLKLRLQCSFKIKEKKEKETRKKLKSMKWTKIRSFNSLRTDEPHLNTACRISSTKLPLPMSSRPRPAALQIALRTQALPFLAWLRGADAR